MPDFNIGDRVLVAEDTMSSIGHIGQQGVISAKFNLGREVYVIDLDDGPQISRSAEKLRPAPRAWVMYFDKLWLGYGPMTLEQAQAAKRSLRLDGFTAYAVPHLEAVIAYGKRSLQEGPTQAFNDGGTIEPVIY